VIPEAARTKGKESGRIIQTVKTTLQLSSLWQIVELPLSRWHTPDHLERRIQTVHCKCCSPVCKISADLRQEHGTATRWFAKYLKETYGKVMSHIPTKDWNLEVFGEEDIADTGTQTVKIRQNPDTDTLLARCPTLWKSRIQSVFTLSGTESEIAGSLYSIRNAIPTMDFNE
jgi:hypothetical protein